jgi:hypothetical protein
VRTPLRRPSSLCTSDDRLPSFIAQTPFGLALFVFGTADPPASPSTRRQSALLSLSHPAPGSCTNFSAPRRGRFRSRYRRAAVTTQHGTETRDFIVILRLEFHALE